MDNKTWLWRKKSSEKTIIPADQKIHNSSKENDEEQALLTEKAKLEKDLKVLNDKLSSVLSECQDKDELEKKHSKMAQEAILGWEKAEAEVVSLRRELDEALQQRVASEERSSHLEVALREYMQQLHFVREDQEKRIHDAVMKTSREFEICQMVLEEKLAETGKKLAKIGDENCHLSNSLLVKEKLVEEVNKQLTQMETDFSELMIRLQFTEKDNASLQYEVRVLEKELEIRNEEKGFNLQTADASHKQHLESVKKIAKLESECQRLRLLVRKRLPGPVALAKMKSEAEMLERDSGEMRQRKLNTAAFKVDSAVEESPENPTKRISILTGQLSSMEEENKNLMITLHKKVNELQFLREMYAHAASKLSQVKLQLEEVSKGQYIVEPTKIAHVSHDLSLASMSSNIGGNDKIRCAESRASALITEQEYFTNGKQKASPSSKSAIASEINLMDDFVEMERLALVTVDKSLGSSQVYPHEANAISSPLEMKLNRSSSELIGVEIVPLPNSESGFSMSKQEINSKVDWLQDVLKMVFEQNHVTQKNPDKLLEDIRTALAHINPQNHIDPVDASNAALISGYISGKPSNKSLGMVSSNCDVLLTEKSNTQLQLNLDKSIEKIIELIEGIGLPSLNYNNPETLARKDEYKITFKNSETPTGYTVRVFQWKTSELSAVLQQFVHTCDDVLNGKANIDKFAQELTTALDWIIKHCFYPQDFSNMREVIMKNFDWDKSRIESEAGGMIGHFSEAGLVPREHLSYFLMTTPSNGNHLQTEELQSTLMEENRKSRCELMNLKSAKDLEGRLQSATVKRESLMNQHLEAKKTSTNLETEFEILKGKTEIQTESQKLMIEEDLDRQLTVARVELNEILKVDDKINCCEELEATSLEQQLHLGSITNKESPNNHLNQEEKHFRTDREITAASEKLAECQEAILNLGKQLKALAAPKEATLVDKVIATATTVSTPTPPKDKIMYQQSSLLDQMLADDDAKALKTKEINGNCTGKVNEAFQPLGKIIVLNGIKHKDENASASSLAILPRKKRGGGSLWRKLLWGRKRANSKKPPLLCAP